MKRPPSLLLSLRFHPGRRSPVFPEGVADPRRRKGMSRWRALGRKQFRALIESPSNQDRPEGRSKSETPVEDAAIMVQRREA